MLIFQRDKTDYGSVRLLGMDGMKLMRVERREDQTIARQQNDFHNKEN